MKRTLSEARRVFGEELSPHLNDYWRLEFESRLQHEEDLARKQAREVMGSTEAQVLALRENSLRELTAVRDELDDLDAAAGEGRLSARALSEKLALLKAQQTQAEAELVHARGLVDRIESIELDPIAWFDGLLERMPLLQPDWPW